MRCPPGLPRARRARISAWAAWIWVVAAATAGAQDAAPEPAPGGGGFMDRFYDAMGRATEIAPPRPDGEPAAGANGKIGGALGGLGMAALRERVAEHLGEWPEFRGIPQFDLRPDGSVQLAMGNYGGIKWHTRDDISKDVTGTVEITARNMLAQITFDPAFNVELYAEGDVQFLADTDTMQARFACDRLTFVYPSFQGLATKVRMRSMRDLSTPAGDFLGVSPAAGLGRRDQLSDDGDLPRGAALREAFATADEVRILNAGHAELINAVVTGDGFAEPHWGVYMPAALYRAGEKIEAYNPTVRVGHVPVLWLPYVIRDLKYDWPWVRVSAGHSSQWGYYQRTAMAFEMPERDGKSFQVEKLRFAADTFSRRGWGLGLGLDYRFGPREDSQGSISFYNISENWTSKRADLKRGEDRNQFNHYQYLDPAGTLKNPDWKPNLYRGDDRIILRWDHYQRFNDKWDLRAEAHYYKDADVGLEYDRAAYLDHKAPGAGFSLRRRTDLWQAELFAQKRINSWQTQTEYLPELRINAPAVQIFETPLYFDTDFRAGVVNRRFGKDALKYEKGLYDFSPLDDPSFYLREGGDYGYFFRAVGDSRVSLPVKMGFATLTPWVGAKYGYYGETFGEAVLDDTSPPGNPTYTFKEGDREGDVMLMGGATLSSTLYATFGAAENWRLTIQPDVAFTVTNEPNVDPFTRYPIDYFDAYGREATLAYGSHFKLQQRNDAGRVRDVLDFGAHIKHYPRAMDQDPRNHGREFTELDVDAVWRPWRGLSVWGSALYDTEYNRFNRILGGVDYRHGDRFRVYAAHARYAARPEDPKPYEARIDETTFAVRSRLWNAHSRYSGEAAVTYNWGDDSVNTRHGLAEYRVAIYRNLWDNFDLGLNYTVNYRRRDHENKIDRGFYLTLTPMGFMGYDAPALNAGSSASVLIAESRYANQPDPRSYAGNDPGAAVLPPFSGDDRLIVPDYFADDPRFQDGLGGYNDATPLTY